MSHGFGAVVGFVGLTSVGFAFAGLALGVSAFLDLSLGELVLRGFAALVDLAGLVVFGVMANCLSREQSQREGARVHH